ncbi:DUF2155 domain-containing protein [Chthonobacter rhizosphaerae]|uniref:DUF2155 domain-containing protein n=1 Tax=Chthonobacter rhizosphaerae TaxID=2735553 RepID=UPI0015EFB6AA|nr:DUF2155 domain-containing protein [Chthonobacter rhizosphaerae]
MRLLRASLSLLAIGLSVAAGPARAEKVANPVAVFTGLDKITGRIITFDVYVDETVQFGALRVTPRVCYTRPPTEAARTDAFVEVDEITLNDEIKRIFSGWMFAASPGLNAVEHPVYDVWLNDCRQESDIRPPSSPDDARTAEANPDGAPTPLETIDGIPIPRPKPAAPPTSIGEPELDLPDGNGEEPPPGEILD